MTVNVFAKFKHKIVKPTESCINCYHAHNYYYSWRTSCLEDKGSEIEFPERSTYLNLLPGQIYNPDDQCRIVNGPESRYKGVR